MVHEQTNNFDVNLDDLIIRIWHNKISIAFFVLLASLIGILISLLLPNYYKSQISLIPADNKATSSSIIGQYGMLAGLAGLSMPSQSSDKTIEALERVKSFDFFQNFFLPNISYKNLVAVDSWESEKNIIHYNKNLYDTKKNIWVENIKLPTNQEAYEIYKKMLSVSTDAKSSVTLISIEHKSPYVAKYWVETIVKLLNDSMRNDMRQRTLKSINFLNEQISKTSVNEIRETISSLQQEQMKSLMLIEVNKDYIFRIIDSAIVPEKKSKPNRSVIIVLTAFIGFFISILTIFLRQRL